MWSQPQPTRQVWQNNEKGRDYWRETRRSFCCFFLNKKPTFGLNHWSCREAKWRSDTYPAESSSTGSFILVEWQPTLKKKIEMNVLHSRVDPPLWNQCENEATFIETLEYVRPPFPWSPYGVKKSAANGKAVNAESKTSRWWPYESFSYVVVLLWPTACRFNDYYQEKTGLLLCYHCHCSFAQVLYFLQAIGTCHVSQWAIVC